ncbi:hypothetical protein LCGC14_0329770 [marine sediment metagenome]|uniref:Uncharacterized protein n=1 Tax=marine sediment metagenome TaxID=412755 RepID=A0A0F9TMB4_9ZZZZ
MPDKEGHSHITKEKLQSQLSRARMILRNEEQADRSDSESARHATRIIYRTEKFLGITPDAPKAGKAKKERRRGKAIIPELEKAAEAARKAAALSAVARRGNKD